MKPDRGNAREGDVAAEVPRAGDNKMRISMTNAPAAAFPDTRQDIKLGVRVSFLVVAMAVAVAGLWFARPGIIG